MGKLDVQTKAFMSVNERFADFFNNILYNGKAIIKPGELQPQNTAEVLTFIEADKEESVQKYRDVFKKAVIKTDEKFCYVFLGIENQRDYHLAMPVKNMIYDAIRYSNQIAEITRKNRKEKKMSGQEFLSGLRKEDKILPVITITLYWRNEKWDAPQKLSEMLVDVDKKVMKYFNDYDINLIQPSNFDNFETFQTDVGEVLQAINLSEDKEQLVKLFYENKAFQNLEPDAALLLNECVKMELKIQENEEGKVDMCKAIEDLKLEARTQGVNEGKMEGRIESIAKIVRKDSENLARLLLDATEEELAKARALL